MPNEDKLEEKVLTIGVSNNLEIGKCYRVDVMTPYEIKFTEVDSQFAFPTISGIVNYGGFSIDYDKKMVKNAKGVWKAGTRTEWKLLQFLASRPNFTYDNSVLLTHVWGAQYVGDTQYLRVWIHRVRALITGDPANNKVSKFNALKEDTPIVNVRSMGYRLNTKWRISS